MVETSPNSQVGVSDLETGANQRAVNEDGGDLLELLLQLSILLLTLLDIVQSLDLLEHAFDERRAGVDLKEFLLLCPVLTARSKYNSHTGSSFRTYVHDVAILNLVAGLGSHETLHVRAVTICVRNNGARASDEAVGQED